MAVIAAPLNLTSNLPVDSREVVGSHSELETIEYPYAGLEVWVKDEAKKYRCTSYNEQTKVAEWADLSSAAVDLVNYYTKNDVDELLQGISQLSFEVVSKLPTKPASGKEHSIYLVPATETGANNEKEEYIYVNNKWEKIGNTTVSLTGYATETYVDDSVNALETSVKSYVADNYYNKLYIDGLRPEAVLIEGDEYLIDLH